MTTTVHFLFWHKINRTQLQLHFSESLKGNPTASNHRTNTHRILEIWHQQAFIYSCYIYFAIPVNIMFPECTRRRVFSKSSIRDLYVSVGFWKDESIMVAGALIFDFPEWLRRIQEINVFMGRVLTVFKRTTADNDKKWWWRWYLRDSIVRGNQFPVSC